MTKELKPLLVHIDIDSPLKLLDFYKIKNVSYSIAELESFYLTSFERALEFFDAHKAKVSFFVVGNELENSSLIQEVVRKAFQAGHEIENHTYTHPFGLSLLPMSEVAEEISKCNEIVTKITGRTPIGFRSPGYSINTEVINLIRELGFKYDSSGFWSIMNPFLKATHKFIFKNGLKNEGFGHVSARLPHTWYSPSEANWLEMNSSGNFLELPMPRTNLFQLPFYHNFNLWSPNLYSNIASNTIVRPYLVYLFHIIEFMDMQDQLPRALGVHPNLKMPVKEKLARSNKMMINLSKKYTNVSTEVFIESKIVSLN
jgi:hypothetical protein